MHNERLRQRPPITHQLRRAVLHKVSIMEIKITRQKAIKDLVEGVLSIDGGPAMDTLENRCSCLKAGEYHAVMKKCKLYGSWGQVHWFTL